MCVEERGFHAWWQRVCVAFARGGSAEGVCAVRARMRSVCVARVV